MDEPELEAGTAQMVDRTDQHDEDPLTHIGEPVYVDYETGGVFELGDADPDAGPEAAS